MTSKNKVTVAKFGGSSMKDATAITRSAKIAIQFSASIIVVSATYGTTNELVELGKLCESGKKDSYEKAKKIIAGIIENHLSIAKDLNAGKDTLDHLQDLFDELSTLAKGINMLKDAPPKAKDRLQSLGERMSSPLMALCLNNLQEKKTENFDVRTVLRTDDRYGKAAPNIEKISMLCQKYLLGAKYGDVIYVTQGFIGATEDGNTTTLGRGGSDYSAALLAEGIGADLLQIWTDVAGIATTDPRITAAARPISEITFKEAAELAVFGAKILHPTTLGPAQRGSIPVFVGSSYEPDAPGTWIKAQCEHQPLVRAMAVKKDQSLLTISTPKMLNTHGFLARIFSLFEKYKVSVDAITTSEISVAMTIDSGGIENNGLINELSELGTVQMEAGLAIVSLIGNNINHTPGLAHKIFKGLYSEREPINVRMICLGASKHNFCLVVKDELAPMAIMRLHKTFIEEEGTKS